MNRGSTPGNPANLSPVPYIVTTMSLSSSPVAIRPSSEPAGGAVNGSGRSSNGTAVKTLATLSPSRAGDFKRCPRLYRYRSIDRIPEVPSRAQARGTTAHLALERLFDLPAEQRTAEQLFNLFREAWTGLRSEPEYSELFDDLDDERAWGIESLGVISNYLTLEDPVVVSPIGNELAMSEELGDVTIRGILDRLDEGPDGGLVITDYKTGSSPSQRYALPAFFALKVYALLVRRKYKRTPTELRLLYLGNSTIYSISVDDRVLDGIERQLLALTETIRRAIDKNNFPPRPSVLCKWCSFRNICPGVTDQSPVDRATDQPLKPANPSQG